MKTYEVHVEYNHGYGVASVETETPQEAMDKALELTDADVSYCSHYDVGADFEHVRITDPDETGETLAEWTAPEIAKRAYAEELYEAAKVVIANWGNHDLATSVNNLQCIVNSIDALSA